MSESYGLIAGEFSSPDSGFSGIVFGSASLLEPASSSDGKSTSESVMSGSGS
jgi:hypothetical protein